MLSRSGENLFNNTQFFINRSENVTLFSAYLKLKQLKELNTKHKINRIIVRWEVQDLCLGVSDIELYDYCIDNNIALYRNTRIHLKAFWDNNDNLIFGSANVTGKGVGESRNYNYELNGEQKNLSFEDILYLNYIISKSEYVSESLYYKLRKLVSETILPTIEYPKLKTTISDIDYFLLSQLPMFKDVENIYHSYSNYKDLGINEKKYLAHDLALYNISLGLNKNDFLEILKTAFNNHPFIISIKENISEQETKSLRYGGVVKWIKNNTTTVPTPISWEIKKDQIVNILYDWICYFDANYYWERPNHSQVIFKKTLS